MRQFKWPESLYICLAAAALGGAASAAQAQPVATGAYTPTLPPGGLDSRTTLPGLWQNATIAQVAGMAAGSVQKTEKNQADGVAGLDASGAVTVPVTGNISQAFVKTELEGALSRALSAYLTENPGAKDFGIALDGTTDDVPALKAAAAAVSAGSIIRVPAGKLHMGQAFTDDHSVLWQLNGTMMDDGAPVTQIGTDVIESTLEGGKYFARGQSHADMSPVIRKDMDITHTGGTRGFVMSLDKDNCTLKSTGADLDDYIWCHSVVLTSSAAGLGEHVASAAFAHRPSDALSDKKGRRAQIWAGYDETRDDTGQSSDVAGSLVGREIDVFANGDDPNGWRIGLQLQVAGSDPAGTPGKIGKGIALGNNDGTSTYGIMFDAAGRFDTAGIDLSASTPVNDAPVLNIGANRNLSFAADHKPHLRFDSASYSLQYFYDTSRLLSVGLRGDITTAISNGADGIAFSLTGDALIGLSLVNLNVPEALRLGSGQQLSWEPTATVSTRYQDGKLTDKMSETVSRTLDDSGNESITGSNLNSGMITTLTNADASAVTLNGQALIGVNLTGLNTTEALRLGSGQQLSWEPTSVIQTGYNVSSGLTDSKAGASLRMLDTQGNETLHGTVTPEGGLHLPALSREQIRSWKEPAIGLVVLDADDDAPVVYTSGGWKLMVLQALPE